MIRVFEIVVDRENDGILPQAAFGKIMHATALLRGEVVGSGTEAEDRKKDDRELSHLASG
ncbi:MAG: hypothetical protein B9S38_04740 [Verrucomicrobiia bacterium Tous-C4TDCM]|nr:MAG: hypothetical protein B9S38_04740 [Verrucomicrobiae bacterium Tous-C4TDCM]